MSRVHISYVIIQEGLNKVVFDVISPDFSENACDRNVIGALHIDYSSMSFSFFPSDELASYFCPPEYFEEYSGDIDMVDKVCTQKGLMCTAWSYQIYRKAKKMIESKV